MRDEALEAVYSYVERSYIRLQAGDLMIRCLEDDSLLPIQQFIEGLFLAGPDSLLVMREVLAEAGRRRKQIEEDLEQISRGFNSSLRSYGVILGDDYNPDQIAHLTPARLLGILRRQNQTERETQAACLCILKESRSLLSSLNARLKLLQNLESYLADWMWGMVYQTTHHPNSLAM